MSLQGMHFAAVKSVLRRLLNKNRRYSQDSNDCHEKQKHSLPLEIVRIDDLGQYREYASSMAGKYSERSQVESSLMLDNKQFDVSGYCFVCNRASTFHVDFQYAFADAQGRMVPNWRERLVCRHCSLNNRMRASVHLFNSICSPEKDDAIYITEQTTPLYDLLRSSYQKVTGSEFLGPGVLPGRKNCLGIRNESLTSLSFEDDKFDYILCFDVFEHVPDYSTAIRECFRVLRPGGKILFSVPFDLSSQENLVRAVVTSQGKIEHLHPPEYHGDPISDSGCLCYYHYGWDFLNEFRENGFQTAQALFYWSREYGYLGGDQFIFMAKK